MKIPDWFIKDAEKSIQQWKTATRWYIVRHSPDANYPWHLEHVDLDGNGGGGAPFKTYDELCEYAAKLGLKVVQQLTLGL